MEKDKVNFYEVDLIVDGADGNLKSLKGPYKRFDSYLEMIETIEDLKKNTYPELECWSVIHYFGDESQGEISKVMQTLKDRNGEKYARSINRRY